MGRGYFEVQRIQTRTFNNYFIKDTETVIKYKIFDAY